MFDVNLLERIQTFAGDLVQQIDFHYDKMVTMEQNSQARAQSCQMRNHTQVANTKQSKRHAEMLQKLRQSGYVSVENFATELGVSEMTVRRDLQQLYQMGLISRHHGGASAIPDAGKVEAPYTLRETEFVEAKQRIGAAAAALVQEGDVVILDAGTTTYQVALQLDQNRLSVVTNGNSIIGALAERSDITLISTGGQLRWESQSYVGPLTLRAIRSINANIAFLSITALSFSKGLTTRDMDVAEVKRAMMNAAERIVLVMDSSKLHKHTLTTVAALRDIHILVTDSGISPDDWNRIESEGVKVVIASP
jgi:DeoR/GlpR family transcriptional regulator of sugar metabolism